MERNPLATAGPVWGIEPVVNEPLSIYVTNLVYVMLSCVNTKKCLFMRKPLSRALSKYVVPKAPENTPMLEVMRKLTPSYWSDEQYNELFGSN